jgi:hypothetical protein
MFQSTVLPSFFEVISHNLQNKSNMILPKCQDHIPSDTASHHKIRHRSHSVNHTENILAFNSTVSCTTYTLPSTKIHNEMSHTITEALKYFTIVSETDLSPLQNVQTVSGYWSFFAGVKKPNHEVDHSPPSSAEVKNEWIHTSTHPICLYRMDRHNFTFYNILQSRYWHCSYKDYSTDSEIRYSRTSIIQNKGGGPNFG